MSLTEGNWDYGRGVLCGVLEHEGDGQVHFVADDVVVFHEDVHVLDPATLYVAQGPRGTFYALPYGLLKAVRRDGLISVTLATVMDRASLLSQLAYLFIKPTRSRGSSS
jgi:hypothetical protein